MLRFLKIYKVSIATTLTRSPTIYAPHFMFELDKITLSGWWTVYTGQSNQLIDFSMKSFDYAVVWIFSQM